MKLKEKTSMLHFYCKMRQIVLLSNGKEGEKKNKKEKG